MPDAIIGDLDSIKSEVRAFYESKGVKVVQDKDEYSTDLMKCIADVPDDWAIVMLGGLSGRVDQTVHTMSMLYKLDREFYVFSEESMTWVLRKVRTVDNRVPLMYREHTRSSSTTKGWVKHAVFCLLV